MAHLVIVSILRKRSCQKGINTIDYLKLTKSFNKLFYLTNIPIFDTCICRKTTTMLKSLINILAICSDL